MTPLAAIILGVGTASIAVLTWRAARRPRCAPPDRDSAEFAEGQDWGTAHAIHRVLMDEISFVIEEARGRLTELRDRGLHPLAAKAQREWRAFAEVVAEDEGPLARVCGAAIEAVETGSGAILGSLRTLSPRSSIRISDRRRRAGVFRARSLWQSLQRARELIFGNERDTQIEEIGGSGARALIRQAEATVNHYLKVASVAMLIAVAGVVVYQPLLWVAAVPICYVAYPAVKSAYVDLFEKGRFSIRVLDAICLFGLLAGFVILVCSITSFIFHASAKLMLKTEDRSRKLIADLFGEQPRTVRVLVDGQEVERAFASLRSDDLLVVHAGQMIPVDGTIAEGTGAVDQHILTGEAQPAEKGPGDAVFAATVLLAGRVVMKVDKTGGETAAAQIRELLANTVDFRAAIQARWQDVADRTVLPTIVLTLLAWVLLGPLAALAILCSNYVAVMKVASPLGMLNFLQRAAQAGILIKDGRTLESSGRVDAVVFDKTGTLTLTNPHVRAVHAFADFPEEAVLGYAAAVEANQSHPIARAILAEAGRRQLAWGGIEEARYDVGFGIQATIEGRSVHVGSERFMAMENVDVPTEFQAPLRAAQARGASVVYVAFDRQAAGAIELQPTLRPEAREVTAELRGMGLDLYIISGDQQAATEALAAEVGIDKYFAEVLPQDKSLMVERLQRSGRRVCFVGDGINDAIALKSAAVSVSLRGASSLATNTAQIVLMDESLKQLSHVFELAHDYDANLRTLLTTTFLPGLVSMAGVFFLGWGPAVALLLFNVSMVAGLLNAVWPALQNLDMPAAPAPAVAGADAGRHSNSMEVAG
jgi:Cu2+-exporting ATPase